MSKFFRRLYYKIFPTYKVLETKLFTYSAGDAILKASEGKPESERWCLAKEKDFNLMYGWVWLCRKIRITE